jgi:uncharacterized protein (TIRG00374 family)
MTTEIRLPKRTSALLLIVGLLIFILYLYFFVPFGEFAVTIQQANLFYYSLALIALFLTVAFYALTWHNLLKLLSMKTSFKKAFQFIWIGTFIDLLIPAESVSGDISRIYLMSKESGGNAGKVAASVISHRILSGVVTFGGFIIGSVYFILKKPEQVSLTVLEFIGVVAMSSTVSLSLLFYLSIRRQVTKRIVNWLINLLVRLFRRRWKLDHLRSSAERILNAFHDGITTLAVHPRGLVLPAFWAIVAWFFDVLIAVLVFFSLGSFGVNISLSGIMIVYSIIIGIQNAPVGVPGEVGLPEIIMTSLYTLLGVPIAMSAAATILIRVLTLGVKLLMGGVAVQWLGIKGLRGSISST